MTDPCMYALYITYMVTYTPTKKNPTKCQHQFSRIMGFLTSYFHDTETISLESSLPGWPPCHGRFWTSRTICPLTLKSTCPCRARRCRCLVTGCYTSRGKASCKRLNMGKSFHNCLYKLAHKWSLGYFCCWSCDTSGEKMRKDAKRCEKMRKASQPQMFSIVFCDSLLESSKIDQTSWLSRC